MKNLRKIMRKYYLRQILACWLVFYMMFGIPASTVLANIGDGGGGTVVAGGATITAPGGTADAYIDLLTSQTVINWQDFDTVTGQLVEFGGVGSAVLNRIVAGGATQFYGNLQALGIDVFIINTRGFIQGPDSFMQARTLVLSGIDIRNEDFLAGTGIYDFKKNAINPFGNVIGDVETLGGGTGAIEAENIALIGRNVINRGILRTTAPGGCVVMAAGESVYLQNIGSNVVVEVDITTSPAAYRVDNGGSMGTGPGTIDAPDSRVVLAAGDIYSTAIEGVESLRAESYTDVTFTGDIDATGDVEITAGVFDVSPIYPDPWNYAGSADLQNVSAGGELSVLANHELVIDGDAESGGDMTLISDYDFWGGDNLTVTGALTSGGDMHVEGLDITLGGNAIATGDMDIIAHGWWRTGKLGDSELTEGTDVWAQGDLIAGGRLNVIGNDLTFDGDVRANGGDLTLTARTAEDLAGGWGDDNGWGDIHVGSGGTLYARDNIHIYNESGPDNMMVYGEDALTLTAETGTLTSDADIYTSAYAASDAEASVTIITGGDLEIDYNIEAEAFGDGVFDAIAAVTIDSGGSVEIKSDGSHTTTIKAEAQDGANNYADVIIDADGDVSVLAKDGDTRIKALAYADGAVLNQANIEITGENVTVKSEDSGGLWDILSPDDALVHAYAHDGGENRANVTITANGEGSGKVTIQSDGPKGDDVLVKAEAKNGTINTATIDITATGDVEVAAYGLFDEALVKAEAWNEIELAPDIPEPEVIGDVAQEVVVDLAVEGLTNTATVDITAINGNVTIIGEGSGSAAVEAVARNDIEVDIDNYDNEVTVNLTVADLENNAGVTIDAGGEGVFVEASGSSSKAGIAAEAYNELEIDQHTGGKYWVQDGDWRWQGHWEYYESYAATLNLDVSGLLNNADIGITADNGNVEVTTKEDGWFDSEAKVEALAWNDIDIDIYEGSTGNLTLDDLTNNANIDITAGYDVEVTAEDGGEAGIAVLAANWLEPDPDASGDITADNLVNNAGVTIDAGGSVEVTADCEGDCSDAYIIADAFNEGDGLTGEPEPGDYIPVNQENTATIDIIAGENVKVIGIDCGDAEIGAEAVSGTDNTASVNIATADGDVLVHGVYGKASIEATAMYAYNNNTATIAIDATGGDVKVIDIGENGDTAKISATATDAMVSNTANVTIYTTAVEVIEEVDPGVFESHMEGGDVKVIAKDGGHAEITAFAGTAGDEGDEGTSNTADVLICADGTVTVSDEGTQDRINTAKIEALAQSGYTNDASVRIGAREGVEVIANNGSASIASRALFGYSNTAETIVCTDGGVLVNAVHDGEAGILAEALYGDITDAYVGICAVDDVLVLAGINPDDLSGGDGIPEGTGGTATVKAEAMADCGATEESTANADVTVVSHEGGVAVIDVAGGETPRTAKIIAEAHNAYSNTASVGVAAYGNFMDLPEDNIGVIVGAIGYDSEARILAYAHDGYENTADVVVCTPGEVVVGAMGDGSFAQIKSWARNGELINSATTQVYASDVEVYVPRIAQGRGIWASAGDSHEYVPYGDGDYDYCLTEDGAVAMISDGATLIIADYSERVDCPECPPCPCEEEAVIFTAAAPLPSEEFPVIEGCPALMQAAALELGIGSETIQVAIERGLASTPNIQPCDTCANIVNYARVLQDVDGTRMAAMLQIFNEIAPIDAPFTPEMGTSIAMAFAGSINDDTMPQYATAMEYIDAFVGYVMALDEGLGSPVGDSVTFVMGKYGDAVTSSDNPNIGAFIAARLEATGG